MTKLKVTEPITHKELCLAVAKRYNKKVAVFEYKSTVSTEEPDVLIFDFGCSYLFEIKVSLSDFKADLKKECRKKYIVNYYMSHIHSKLMEEPEKYSPRVHRQFFLIKRDHPKLIYVEPKHLGNKRYYVCPWGLIPVELVPEGWGLLYYRNGKFYEKKKSGTFRTNYMTEQNLLVHAFRRYASGDNTGIIVNTYGGEK